MAHFDELHEWSERKQKVIRKYVDGAARILGRMGTVYYVDGFAGRGTYGRPGEVQVPGSPLHAAQLAHAYESENRSWKLRCINVEIRPDIYTGLVAATGPYSLLVENLPGSFASNLDRILTLVGTNPVVCFLDPFGVDGIDLSLIERFVRRRGVTDFWIRFDAHEVRRRPAGMTTLIPAPRPNSQY